MEDILTIPSAFTPHQSTLAGKVILVTGAASEIGHAVILAAASSGATVLMLDQKQRNMTSLYDKICDQESAEPMMIEFDMIRADAHAYARLGTSLAEQYSKLDGLVHCAMWGAPLTPVSLGELETWSTVIDQQLIKPMYLTKTLLTILNRADHASIIFTVMDIGRAGRAYWGPVGAAFAGLENLSESLAAETSDNPVRVNTLDPGKVKSAFRKKFYPGESGKDLREAHDDKIVNAYLYLLSDLSLEHSAQRFSVKSLDD